MWIVLCKFFYPLLMFFSMNRLFHVICKALRLHKHWSTVNQQILAATKFGASPPMQCTIESLTYVGGHKY